VACDGDWSIRKFRWRLALRRGILFFLSVTILCVVCVGDERGTISTPPWQFGPDSQNIQGVTVGIVCPAAQSVFSPSDEKAVQIEIANPSAASRSLQFRSAIFDFRGRAWEESSQPVTVPAGEKVLIKKVLSGSRKGFFNLSVELKAGDKTTVRNFPFAVLDQEPQGFRKNSLFGVVTDDLSRARAYARLGAKWVLAEDAARWDRIETTQGELELAALDELARARQENSVFVVPVLGFPPEWAYTVWAESKPGLLRLSDVETWKAYLAAAATRLAGTVNNFAVWDVNQFSTDLWDLPPAQYKQLLSTARPSIAAANPNSVICAAVPELALVGRYVQGQNVAFAMDAAVIQARDEGDPEYGLYGYLCKALQVLRDTGTDSVWVISPERAPQSGWPAQIEPAMLVREYVVAAAAGAKRLFWDCRRPGALLSPEGSPTPAGCAYAVASRNFGDAALARTLWPTSTNLWGFVFNRSDDTRLAVMWQTGPDSTLALAQAEGFVVSDLMGNSTGRIEGDALILPLGAEPVYIEARMPLDAFASSIENATIESPQPIVASAALAGDGTPGNVWLQVTLTNLTNRPLSGAVKVTAAPAWELAEQARPFDVIPGGDTGIVEFAFSRPATDGADAYEFDLAVLVAGKEYRTHHVVRWCLAEPISPVVDGDLAEWSPDSFCRMEDASFLVRPSGRWTPANLSAAIALGWDAKNLYIAAQVTDDVHGPGDAMLVAFDVLPDRAPNGARKRFVAPGTDVQYRFALTGEAAGVTRRGVWQQPPGPGTMGTGLADQLQPTSATVRIRRLEDEKHTEYEVAIPVAELGALNPLVAKQVALNIRIDDGETPGLSLDWARPTTTDRTVLTFHPFDQLNAPARSPYYFARPTTTPEGDQ